MYAYIIHIFGCTEEYDNSHISSRLQKHVVLAPAQSGYPGCRQTEKTVVMRPFTLVLKSKSIRQPKRLPSSSYNHNTLETLIHLVS